MKKGGPKPQVEVSGEGGDDQSDAKKARLYPLLRRAPAGQSHA
jgi:hypothetical protein